MKNVWGKPQLDFYPTLFFSCGLDLPPDNAIVNTAKNCARRNGLGTPGAQAMCNCIAKAGVKLVEKLVTELTRFFSDNSMAFVKRFESSNEKCIFRYLFFENIFLNIEIFDWNLKINLCNSIFSSMPARRPTGKTWDFRLLFRAQRSQIVDRLQKLEKGPIRFQ